jgi:hypothetical protein
MDEILDAAGALFGESLTDPTDLGGSGRSRVLRARAASGRSVIVKAFTEEPEALRAFTGEAVGLSLGAGGPELLAADPDRRLLIMTDLGAAPTLADLLLGDDPAAVERALLAWARGLGELAVAAAPRRAEFDALWSRYHLGLPAWDKEPWTARNAESLPTVLAAAGVEPAPGLAAELDRIGTAGGDRYPAFTPGDTCPDNNLITADGLRLIDFEAACFQSAFLTAAYVRMPFSTCWCVFTLPTALAERTERTYREQLVTVHPELAEDTVWEAGLAAAVAVWTVEATVRLLPRVLTEDAPLHPRRHPVASRRQLLRHRWTQAAALPGHPALTETLGRLLKLAEEWEVAELPPYPAFNAAPAFSPGARAGS